MDGWMDAIPDHVHYLPIRGSEACEVNLFKNGSLKLSRLAIPTSFQQDQPALFDSDCLENERVRLVQRAYTTPPPYVSPPYMAPGH